MAKKKLNFLAATGITGLIAGTALAGDLSDQAKFYQEEFVESGIKSTMVGNVNVSGYSVQDGLTYTLVSPNNDVLVLEDDAPLGSLDRVMNCSAFRYPLPCKKVEDKSGAAQKLYVELLSVSDKILNERTIKDGSNMVNLYDLLIKR